MALDPVAAGLADGVRAELVAVGYGDGGAEARSEPVAVLVALRAPELTAETPNLPAVGGIRDRVTFWFDDGDGCGLDLFAAALAVAWRGPDGTARELVEGTDFLRTAPQADALTVILTNPVEGRYDFTVAGADHLGNADVAAVHSRSPRTLPRRC